MYLARRSRSAGQSFGVDDVIALDAERVPDDPGGAVSVVAVDRLCEKVGHATPHCHWTVSLAPPSPAVPILLGLASHSQCHRVLDLEPVIDPAGAVRRAEPLGYDALASERAGVLVEDRTVAREVLVEGVAG